MPTLDLRDVPRDGSGRLAGQGERGSASQHAGSAVTFWRPPTTAERIYTAVLQNGGAATRLDIARTMGVKKTPWLVMAIEALVAEGLLVKTASASKWGALVYWYETRGDER